jgi:hypothetical protein
MPSYLIPGNIGSSGGSGCCCDSIDVSSAVFFNNLATKLLDMSKAIEKRISDLSSRVCVPTKGVKLIEISAPSMNIGVKYEYIEYIKRIGPPTNGIFDPVILEKIRKELGIVDVVI